MNRTSTKVALCVVLGAFAMSAAAASSASAEAPEFGRCVKQVGGKFKNAGCSIFAKTAAEEKYEWVPGPGVNNKFTSTGGATTLYQTRAGNSASCISEQSSGEYLPGTDNKHETTTILWTGCKVVNSPDGVLNGASCTSPGLPAGEVTSNPLVGEVGWENKSLKHTALLLEPASGYGHVFLVAVCGGYTFESVTVGRGLLVKIANDSMKLEEKLKYAQTSGIQKPLKWHVGEGGQETTYLFTAQLNEQSGTAFEQVIKKEEKLELNAVV